MYEFKEAEFKNPNFHSFSVPDLPEDAVFSEDITAEYIQRLYEQAVKDSAESKVEARKATVLSVISILIALASLIYSIFF